MRFGLALPQYGFSLEDGQPVDFEVAASWAERAEDLGFDSVWLSDHFFYSFARYGGDPTPIEALEPMTTLAGLATRTARVRLGTLVLCSSFRHPSLLAKMAATIDALSGGRLDLGLGAGWLEQEFDAFGFPFGTVADRFATLEETLGVLAALRSDGPATYEGRTVRLHDARVLPRPARNVPVWLGGKGGPRLLNLAARFADGWNVVWRIEPADYAERAAAAREACASIGRDPATLRLSVGLHAIVGETERAAVAAFERARDGFPGGAMADESWESWCADTLSGSTDRVIDRVGRFASLGVEEIVISPWALPFAAPEPEIVAVLAERVMEPFRAGR